MIIKPFLTWEEFKEFQETTKENAPVDIRDLVDVNNTCGPFVYTLILESTPKVVPKTFWNLIFKRKKVNKFYYGYRLCPCLVTHYSDETKEVFIQYITPSELYSGDYKSRRVPFNELYYYG